MLRITANESAGVLTFRLEGRLDGPWVREPEQCRHRSPWCGREHRILRHVGIAARAGFGERARLNVITHLLSRIPYKRLPRDKVELPKRWRAHGYREPEYPYEFVPETF